MGRKKINPENKKKHLSIVVSPENFIKLKKLNTNDSKFVNELLKKWFNQLEDGGK